MTAGYLEPVVAEAIFDVSKFVPGITQATRATTDLTGGLDRAGVAAAKMETAVIQAALKAADAQAKAAAATDKATAATSAAVKAGIQASDGQISLAEATSKATAAKDAQTAADRAQADAALVTQRALIAQSEAQLAVADSAKTAADSQVLLGNTSVAAAGKIAGTTETMAARAGVLGVAFTTLKENWITAAAVIGLESINLASKFDTQMERLRTQAGYTQAQVDSMKGSVLSLAGAVGQSPEKLAEALFHVASDGYSGAQALDILKLAAEGASASGANLDDTVYTLTSTAKALGSEGLAAVTKDMATLNAIVGAGDLRFQDLNGALGTGILGTISTFHISLQSLGGALDYLTQRGEPAQQSATRLAMGITLLAAPSKAAAGILHDLGLTNNDLADSATAAQQALSKSGVTTTKFAADLRQPDGIFVAIKDLNDHLKDTGLTADESGAVISRAFGGGRTGKAIMQLASDVGGVSSAYNQVIANTGKFQDDFQATTKTLGFQWHAFLASLEADAINLGHALEPAVADIFRGFKTLGDVLQPVKHGLEDVWHAGQDLQHALEPLEHLLETVFGAAIVGTIDAVGFALRDVVAPAIKGVADGLEFLDRHKEIVIGLGTVIGVALIPKLIEMGTILAGDVVAGAAFAAVNLAGSIGAASEALVGFVAANPELAVMAVVTGGIAAAFALGGHNTRSFTVDIQGLTDAVKKLQATGTEKPLADTLLHDISTFKQPSSSSDAISYLQKYGVAAGDLAAQLANPANLKGIQTFTNTVAEDFFVNQGQPSRAKTVAKDLADLKPLLATTNPAVATLGHLFTNLLKDPTVNLGTIQDLTNDFRKLSGTIGDNEKSTAAYTKAQKDLNTLLTGQGKQTIVGRSAADYITLADAQKEVKGTSQDLVAISKALAPEMAGINKVLDSQIDFFKGVANQSDLTAATLLKNAQDTVNAYRNEAANIKTLVAEGASPDLIKALFEQGPQTVGLAAGAGPDFVKQYQGLLTQAEQSKATTAGVAQSAIDPVGTFEKALAAQQHNQAIQDQFRAILIGNFQPVADQLLGLATFTGKGVPENVAQSVLEGKFRIISAFEQGLTGPQRTAVNDLETLATSGGAAMQANLASAIQNHTPLVISKAEALKLGINTQIQGILSEWGITVDVTDNATAQLQALQGVIKGLYGDASKAGVGVSGFNLAKLGGLAAGGVVRGPGTGTSDSILGLDAGGIPTARVSNGEMVVNEKSTNKYLPLLKAINADKLAGGGLAKLATLITLNITSDVNKLAAAAPTGNNPQGAGVTRWAPDVLQVLSQLGLSPALLPRVLAQIATESGGNPLAINLTDSNAAKGTPSKGVLQTIDPTFYAYAGPYAALGPYNGLADIYAGVNYAAHRYAGDPNIGLGYGHGYAAGGVVGGDGGSLEGLAYALAVTGNLTGIENQRAKYNTANFGRATAANVPGLQLAAEHAAASARLVGGIFSRSKAELFHMAHSGSPAQRKAAGTLYNTLSARAGQLSTDAHLEEGLLNSLRGRYAGREASPLVPGRPTQDLSYLAFAGAPTVGGPSHINLTVVSQLDGREVSRTVTKHQLHTGVRNLSNGATPIRSTGPRGT